VSIPEYSFIRFTLLVILTASLLSRALHAQPPQGRERVARYQITLYEGVPPDSTTRPSRPTLNTEKPLLTVSVEAGKRFNAKGTDVTFDGMLLAVKNARADLRIDHSKVQSTSCDAIVAKAKLNEPIRPSACGFSSVIFLYYFKVRPWAR